MPQLVCAIRQGSARSYILAYNIYCSVSRCLTFMKIPHSVHSMTPLKLQFEKLKGSFSKNGGECAKLVHSLVESKQKFVMLC